MGKYPKRARHWPARPARRLFIGTTADGEARTSEYQSTSRPGHQPNTAMGRRTSPENQPMAERKIRRRVRSPGEKWAHIDGALARGQRGLLGGSSLARLLTEKRGHRNIKALPDLTTTQVLEWADAHHQKTGLWPNQKSGVVMGARGETWAAINGSLNKGRRGLPRGFSVPQLLAKKRGVRNIKALPDLTVRRILKWADGYHQKTGQWPNRNSGAVLDAPGEKWRNIQNALYNGLRGLPGGSSLAKLLRQERG